MRAKRRRAPAHEVRLSCHLRQEVRTYRFGTHRPAGVAASEQTDEAQTVSSIWVYSSSELVSSLLEPCFSETYGASLTRGRRSTGGRAVYR